MGDHPESGAFAVGNDEQYRPVQAVGDQRVLLDGSGLLVCHASRPLGSRGRGDRPLVVVVHGALRDSDRYLAHARRAARRAGRDPLIVAPQFLADVDAGRRPVSLPGRCTGVSRAGRAAIPRSEPWR